MDDLTESWQSIETIPKTGEEVITRNGRQGGVYSLVRWDKLHNVWKSKGSHIYLQATHWMGFLNSRRRTMNNLTEEEMFIYKWQHGMLGSFMGALVMAISLADKGNMHRLSLGFPMEVSAYKKFSGVEGWWQEVEALPQPDLTKLREVYSKQKNSITPYEEDWKGSYLIILWHAIKEVLDAETSNSANNG